MTPASEAVTGALYRRTRLGAVGSGVWYTRAPKPGAEYAGELEKLGKHSTGRDIDLARKLRSGWLPFYRHQRGRSHGDTYTRVWLVALPPDTPLRRVKRKPGFGGRR